MNVTNFALESIKSELFAMESKSIVGEKSSLSSEINSSKKCLCSIRNNYRLPCRHVLQNYEGVFPLDIVHQRWRVYYIKGNGKC